MSHFRGLMAAIALAAILMSIPAWAEIRSRTFTPQEITKMQNTTAAITTDLGNIELRFFPDAAPNHVDNFITLAKKGFYDGTLFHRVIPGFMIQGGDPKGNGTGGPGYSVKAEFNSKHHARGTLSMARSQHPDSAGSQFFICVSDAGYLDGKYTVFGEVVSGMEVVDRIVAVPRDRTSNRPLMDVKMTRVRIMEPKPEPAPEPPAEGGPADKGSR